jgi:hypothetical protein
MSTIVTRASKGSAISWTEADANIINLNNDKLEKIEADLTPRLGANLNVNGRSIVSVSNGDINITPNGSGRVFIDTITVGQGAGNVTSNTAIGIDALANNTTGSNNTALGRGAAFGLTNGTNNTVIGHGAGYRNANNSSMVAIGAGALSFTVGGGNIGIGFNAGSVIDWGANNTVIGQLAGTAGLTGTVLIGAGTTERIKVDSTGLYINGSAYNPTTNLDGLTDVVITTPSFNQLLKFDGTNWINSIDESFSGDYNDLFNKPPIPADTSDLNNNSGFITLTSISASGDISYNNTTGVISYTSPTLKTINSNNLIGTGDIAVQATLVSGTNIKTINGSSILGSGNITIEGGTGGAGFEQTFLMMGA